MADKSLIADLAIPPKSEVGSCKLQKLIEGMPDNEQEAVKNAVELIRSDHGNGHGRVYTTTWLTRILKKNGLTISVSAVQRHVNKECACV